VHFHIAEEIQKTDKVQYLGGHEKVSIPLVLNVARTQNEFVLDLIGNVDYIDQNTALRVLNYLEDYLHQMLETNNINMLLAQEHQKLFYDWNQTESKYPKDKTIQQLFEEQVERTPNNIALVYEDKQLTYQELNERANQLAHYLVKHYDIRLDSLVSLCLDRSEHMIIAILAVLKAGGAYVPMDPSFPDERIRYILGDTKTRVVISNELYEERLRSLGEAGVLALDTLEIQKELSKISTKDVKSEAKSNNLAYVIYTSGTTGQPKGVMIEHKGVVNTILSLNSTYDFTKGNKLTAFTSYTFDVSVSEFFTGLFRGGELHLLSERTRSNPSLISEYITNHEINYLYLPPVLLANLPTVKYNSLLAVIYAGEPCSKDSSQYWSDNYKLYNYYGPTETSIYASSKQIINGDTNLIGSPIANTKYYVLDKYHKPLPIGVIGELYIGGDGLAREYLNQPELTKERFIPNPYQTQEEKLDKSYWESGRNAKIYRTGDLVRWLSCGNIEYIGRNDFQVKIKGFRIELGEIENALSSYDGVKQSVVLAKEKTGNKYLVGYYVSDAKLEEELILKHLQSKLPDYMVPKILVHLEKLPLTINGKLDKNALPDPEFINSNDYVAPRDEIEKEIVSILAGVLGLSIDKVGVNDNFFRLGGDSLATMRAIAKINKAFNASIDIRDIFLYPTISQLGDQIRKCTESSNELRNVSNA
jgi:amino acid adenylation domain-containing protein